MMQDNHWQYVAALVDNPDACDLQTVFETLRTFCGDTAAQSAAAR